MNKATRRYHRTVFLGVAAMAVLVWAAIEQFEIPPEDVKSLILGALLITAVVVICAALFTALWIFLRRVFRRSRDTD